MYVSWMVYLRAQCSWRLLTAVSTCKFVYLYVHFRHMCLTKNCKVYVNKVFCILILYCIALSANMAAEFLAAADVLTPLASQ
jgi:hypothetical protein